MIAFLNKMIFVGSAAWRKKRAALFMGIGLYDRSSKKVLPVCDYRISIKKS
jgi:hypothetical protein